MDEFALRRLVRRQIEGGVQGLVPCGTTGEAVTLDPDEHERVVAVVADEARRAPRPVRVIAGCGSNDTKKSQKLAKRCGKAGADALLVVTPYYNKPTQKGLIEHFRAVADAGELSIVLYNVPGRTGVNMLAETVLALAEDPRFSAVKEASLSLDQACEILRSRPAGFAVLSGEDSLALPMIACGADGLIAVVSNEAPPLDVRAGRGRARGRPRPGGRPPGEALPAHARELPRVEPDPGQVGDAAPRRLRRGAPASARPALGVASCGDGGSAPDRRAPRRRRKADGGSAMTRDEVLALLEALEAGEVRAAKKDASGRWVPNREVKEGILAAFRIGVDVELIAGPLSLPGSRHAPAASAPSGRSPRRPGRDRHPPRRLRRERGRRHAAGVHQRRRVRRRGIDDRQPRPRRLLRADREARPPLGRLAGGRRSRAGRAPSPS